MDKFQKINEIEKELINDGMYNKISSLIEKGLKYVKIEIIESPNGVKYNVEVGYIDDKGKKTYEEFVDEIKTSNNYLANSSIYTISKDKIKFDRYNYLDELAGKSERLEKIISPFPNVVFRRVENLERDKITIEIDKMFDSLDGSENNDVAYLLILYFYSFDLNFWIFIAKF